MASVERVLVVELNDNPEYQRILEGPPQTLGMRSGRVHLEAGRACGQHSTKQHEEILVFLRGRGELLIGEEEAEGSHPKGGWAGRQRAPVRRRSCFLLEVEKRPL